MSEKKINIKKRNWAFIAYPDSAPDNWTEILREKGFACAISPLHDRDTDPDEKEKKPHWHVIVCYSGPTSKSIVKLITNEVNGSEPMALEQVKGYYRYFTHKDNPEKFQYDEKEIRALNGFNVADFIEFSRGEINAIKRMLQALIREKHITEYAEFMDYLTDNEMLAEYDVASCHTYFFDKYITSKRNIDKARQEARNRLNHPSAHMPVLAKHLVHCEKCGESKPDTVFVSHREGKGICKACFSLP
jgi:hypothetical protein